MLLLDLSVDFNYGIWENEYTWNYAKGIYGKPWIYSTVPNFGGRTAPAGALDFYLNGHLNALSSANMGNLVGAAPLLKASRATKLFTKSFQMHGGALPTRISTNG